MTKRDYVLIAHVLRANIESLNYAQRVGGKRIAEDFADELAATNPRFDRGRFLAACGVER